MSTNKLTAIIISGDTDSVIKAINSIENISIASSKSTQFTFQDVTEDLCETSPIEYSAHTWNFTNQNITTKQKTAAKMYLAKNSIVRFDNLMNYIQSATTLKPSNAALSNFLRTNKYKRKILKDTNLGTTKIIWKKD